MAAIANPYRLNGVAAKFKCQAFNQYGLAGIMCAVRVFVGALL
jgi:hypothetical protein